MTEHLVALKIELSRKIETYANGNDAYWAVSYAIQRCISHEFFSVGRRVSEYKCANCENDGTCAGPFYPNNNAWDVDDYEAVGICTDGLSEYIGLFMDFEDNQSRMKKFEEAVNNKKYWSARKLATTIGRSMRRYFAYCGTPAWLKRCLELYPKVRESGDDWDE